MSEQLAASLSTIEKSPGMYMSFQLQLFATFGWPVKLVQALRAIRYLFSIATTTHHENEILDGSGRVFLKFL